MEEPHFYGLLQGSDQEHAIEKSSSIFHWSLMCSVQGGIASGEQAFPIAFSMPFTALGTVDISAWNSSYNNYDDEFTLTKTSIKFRYFPHHFVAFGIQRQGVTGRNTCNWPIAFPSKCLMASAALTPNNANDDLWDADLFMYFTCTTVRRGGEGRNLYHIGVGV